MKLIIDIPEEAYKARLNNPVWFDSNMDNAIRNGKPLLKGHWIDNKIQTKLCNCSECNALSKVYFNYCPHCGAKMEENKE